MYVYRLIDVDRLIVEQWWSVRNVPIYIYECGMATIELMEFERKMLHSSL